MNMLMAWSSAHMKPPSVPWYRALKSVRTSVQISPARMNVARLSAGASTVSATTDMGPRPGFDLIEDSERLAGRAVARVEFSGLQEKESRLVQPPHFGEALTELHTAGGFGWTQLDGGLVLLDRLLAPPRVLQRLAEQQTRPIMIGREVHRLAPQRDRV